MIFDDDGYHYDYADDSDADRDDGGGGDGGGLRVRLLFQLKVLIHWIQSKNCISVEL